MRLIVTRPAAQASGWVRALRALSLDAQALPLIAIAPAADAAPVQAAWRRLPEYALVVFVSANAVAQFFAHRPAAGVAGSAPECPAPECPAPKHAAPKHAAARWPAGVLAGSTGPGTSAALRDAGVGCALLVEPAADSASFDSEALWLRLDTVRGWAGTRVLVVRGLEGRDWLADTLRERGALVDFVAAYARRAPRLDTLQAQLLAAALAAPTAHVWLFSSSEAVANLQALAPAARWSDSAAIASHPRIAQTARAAGFGTVALVPPSPPAVAEQLARWPPPIHSSPS